LELSKLQNEVYSYIDLENSKNSNFKDYKLYLFKFIYNKHSIRIFMTKRGPLNSFFLGQYRFNEHVGPEDGDYIIDCGACWGDSTLEFASRVGDRGKIFAYEFIPKSKQILKKNIELNPSLAERIELIDNAVWNESGIDAYYKDNGPGSRVEMQIFNEYEGKTKTLSIDDLVKTRKVPRLDWIKMDIEGAEPYALEGSIYTIKRFRPNLAISIYHNMDDFSQITPWLEELGVGYKFYIKHFTIHSEETVLFAIVN
jgi:FkbM family methyltransferase